MAEPKTKKKKAVEEDITENPQVIEETPVETEETKAEETPVEETPVETKAEESPVEEPKPVKKQTNIPEKVTATKEVPTVAELRKLRRHNESIFRYEDGFQCVATSQRVADDKHNLWLA